jgi:hypothetical protein
MDNEIMMRSRIFFESAWPALIGWTSGGCIALYYVPQLIICNYVWISTCLESHTIVPFPMNPENILNLVYLLFGFGSHNIIKNTLLKKP